MATTMTQQGIPAVEFPIKRPPPRYPVVAQYDAGRIVLHEPRYQPWMVGDVVMMGNTPMLIRDEGDRTRAIDISAEYDAMIAAAELADIEATQNSIVGQV